MLMVRRSVQSSAFCLFAWATGSCLGRRSSIILIKSCFSVQPLHCASQSDRICFKSFTFNFFRFTVARSMVFSVKTKQRKCHSSTTTHTQIHVQIALLFSGQWFNCIQIVTLSRGGCSMLFSVKIEYRLIGLLWYKFFPPGIVSNENRVCTGIPQLV